MSFLATPKTVHIVFFVVMVGFQESSKLNNVNGFKKILYLTPITRLTDNMVNVWNRIPLGCKYNQCVITNNPELKDEVEAVAFQRQLMFDNMDITNRRADQIWVYFVKESPYTAPQWKSIKANNMLINWTANYRQDSTIYLPNSELKRLPRPIAVPENMAALRERKVAWLVSHCKVSNKRMEYARELQKYIDVDIFGKCGDIPCEGGKKNHTCKGETLRKYKFYLAFENTNCRDYISEKLWRNSFKNGILPIVMGALKRVYTEVSPPNSFIHVDDYDSPRDLANYLHMLDQNDKLYNKYFEWMANYVVVTGPAFLCELCRLLYTRKGITSWYSDMDVWFNNTDTCVQPSADNPYGSWKIAGYE